MDYAIKNNKGITLVLLIVTILIMLLLTGIVIYYSNISDKANFQMIYNNMSLIQTQVRVINERAVFQAGFKLGEEPKLPTNPTVEEKDEYNRAKDIYDKEKEKFDIIAQQNFVGTKLKDVPNKKDITKGVMTDEELEYDYNYIYTEETFNSIGIKGINLAEDEIYIVNYITLDIIYPKGCIGLDGSMKYRLSQMLETSQTENETCVHVWTEWESSSNALKLIQHERKCIWCGTTQTESHDCLDQEASCTKEVICSICNTVVENKKEHDYSVATCTLPAKCKSCGLIKEGPLGHNWGNWIITTSATCQARGERKRTCSRCSVSETETYGPIDHSWVTKYIGSYSYKQCSVCGQIY